MLIFFSHAFEIIICYYRLIHANLKGMMKRETFSYVFEIIVYYD
jgi:hypothetical protein